MKESKSREAHKILHINMYPRNTNIDIRSRSKGGQKTQKPPKSDPSHIERFKICPSNFGSPQPICEEHKKNLLRV